MEINKNKSSRASQTRSKTERPKVWTPPSSLDAPKAPEGYRHRWIRVESMGFDDTKNVQGKLRSGFELVRAEDYEGGGYPVIGEGKYKGMIGVGGLVLARIPEEIALARTKYFQSMTRDQNEALEHDLRREQHNEGGMTFSQERQSRVQFGGKNKDKE
tara:strand:+ start:296 stop:769 length:474 start_codon:yes stop_codon:yes gene_type:complete